MYSVCDDRDQLRLEQLELLLLLTVRVNFWMVSSLRSKRYNITFLVIYNLEADSYLVMWELECLELQHVIVTIFGGRFLKIYFLDLLFSKAHI